MSTLHLLANSSGDLPPLAGLAQYGAAGLILMILLWFGWQVIKREQRKTDDYQAKYEALQTKVADTYVPSMEKWAAALAETQKLLAEIREDRAPPRRRS